MSFMIKGLLIADYSLCVIGVMLVDSFDDGLFDLC